MKRATKQQPQHLRIKEYILKNGSITSLQAYQDLGITQLAARLKDLKKTGVTVNAEWVEVPTRTRGNQKVRVKRYTIPKTRH